MHTLAQTHTSGLGSTDDCSTLCFFEEGGYKAVSQRLHSSQSLTATAKASSILAYNTAGASGGAVAVLSKSSLAMDGYTVSGLCVWSYQRLRSRTHCPCHTATPQLGCNWRRRGCEAVIHASQ